MLFKKLLPLYNVTMERLIGASRFSKSEEAQFRLRVVDFSKKYSIKAAADASGVSRATIFRWRRCLKNPGVALIVSSPNQGGQRESGK